MSAILVEDRGPVRLLTLNRPDKRNALDRAGWAELDERLAEASADPMVGVVAMTGIGGAFCAGADLKESRATPHTSMASHPFHAFTETLLLFPKPLIAAVAGPAIGGGMTMLLHFDFVLAAPSARFRLPFSAIGALPEGGSSLLLERCVGSRVAARLLLNADWLEAEEALTTGFLTALTGEQDLLERALALGAQLAAYPRDALLGAKRLMVSARHDAVMGAFSRERAATFALSRERAMGSSKA